MTKETRAVSIGVSYSNLMLPNSVQSHLPSHHFPSIVLVVGLLALSGEAQCLVGGDLASHAVHGGENGSSQDHTQRDQLWRNLLQRSETLGDSVC